MKQKLERLLDIRAGEWPSLTLMWFAYFLTLLGLYLGYFARESLFLKYIGADYLPAMYIVNAVAVMLVTAVYSSLASRMNLPRLNMYFMLILILLTGITYGGVRYGENLFYIILHTLVDMSWTVFIILFWSLASHLYDAFAAKRIFTIIASGWTAAMILSGLVTPWLLRVIDIRDFLVVWMLLLVAVVFVFRIIFARYVTAPQARRKNEEDAQAFAKTLLYIRSSPYLRLLVSAAVLHWLVMYMVDFYTAKTAAATYADAKELAAFFGKVVGVVGAVAMTLQLLVTGRLIKTFGVAFVFVSFPVLLAFSAVPMAVEIVLGTLVIARIAEYALGISIYDTTFQLFYNPISDEWRTQVRTFIDGSIKPLAVMASGVIIAAMAKFLPIHIFPFVFICILLVFIRVAWRLRNAYGKMLVMNLEDGIAADAAAPADTRMESEHASALIRDGLKSESEETVVFTLDVLARSHRDEYLPQVARLLQDERRGIRIAAMRALARIGNLEKLPGIRFILEDHTESLCEAIDTYAAFLKKDAAPEIVKFLDDPDPNVRCAACENIVRYEMTALLDRALEGLQRSLHGPAAQIKAVGIIGTYKIRVLLDAMTLLFDPAKPAETDAAILYALRFFPEDRTVGILFSALENETLSHPSFLSLKEICARQPELVLSRPDRFSHERMRFVPFLLEDMAWKDIEGFFNARLADSAHAGYAIQALLNRKRKGLPAAVADSVIERFINDVLKDIAALQYAAAFLRSRDTGQAFTLVVAQCKTDDAVMKSNLFAALSLRYDMNKMDLIFTCLRSNDQKYRALGLETMENILPRTQASQIIPLFDNLPLMEIGDLAHSRYGVRFNRLDDLWPFLARYGDAWLNLAMLHALRAIASTFTIPDLLLPLKEGAQAMLQIMDKVFFLKSIPLFAELSVDELFRLAELAREKKFAARSVVFNEGEFGDSLYLIINGTVNICKTKEIPAGKEEIVLATLKEKDCFGEMAILSGEPRSATVKANAPLTTLEIDKKNFSEFMRARPQVSEAIIKVLIQRLRAASARN